jgi:gentisate 1,2-dioxygenase
MTINFAQSYHDEDGRTEQVYDEATTQELRDMWDYWNHLPEDESEPLPVDFLWNYDELNEELPF